MTWAANRSRRPKQVCRCGVGSMCLALLPPTPRMVGQIETAAVLMVCMRLLCSQEEMEEMIAEMLFLLRGCWDLISRARWGGLLAPACVFASNWGLKGEWGRIRLKMTYKASFSKSVSGRIWAASEKKRRRQINLLVNLTTKTPW